MNGMNRGLKGLLALGALAGLGLGLRWISTDLTGAATTEDLTAMASLAIAAVAWLAYAWLLIAVLATVLEQTPGAVGRAASVVAARITSQGSRALLRSALGVAAVTPLTIGVAHAAPADSGPHRAWTAVEPASTVRIGEPSPTDWRTTEKPSTIRLTNPRPATPNSVAVPQDQPRRVAVPGELPRRVAVPTEQPPRDVVPGGRVGVPDRPTQGAPTRYTDLRSGRPVRPAAAAQVVKPGDSLWALASAELGPGASDTTIAARWPAWYAANRAAIGPDPDLIHPGQALHTPIPEQTLRAPAKQQPALAADQAVPPTHEEK